MVGISARTSSSESPKAKLELVIIIKANIHFGIFILNKSVGCI